MDDKAYAVSVEAVAKAAHDEVVRLCRDAQVSRVSVTVLADFANGGPIQFASKVENMTYEPKEGG